MACAGSWEVRVPEDETPYEHPETLLAGSDRPRPLPPRLRTRLEEVLGTAGDGAPARELSAEVRGKLENSLRPAGGGAEKKRKRWAVVAPTVGAAAAIVIAAAVAVPALVHGPNVGAAHTAAGTLAQRSRLSTVESQPSGAASRATKSGAAYLGLGRPAHSGPAKALAPGPSAQFATARPTISNLSPSSGPASGGDWVVVNGANLGRATSVYFGRVAAARFSALSSTELRVLAPAHEPGTVDVLVAGPAGRSQVSPADRYSFVR